jgi:hypothetical protein
LRWLGLGDANDFYSIQELANNLQTTWPDDLPSLEDLSAIGARNLDVSAVYQRDVPIGEPILFYCRTRTGLAAVVLRVIHGPSGNLILSYVGRTEGAATGANASQFPMPAAADGHWSVVISYMDGRDISAARIAPGRFRIVVMPYSPTYPTEAQLIGRWEATQQFKNGDGSNYTEHITMTLARPNQLSFKYRYVGSTLPVVSNDQAGTWKLGGRMVTLSMPIAGKLESRDMVWTDGTLTAGLRWTGDSVADGPPTLPIVFRKSVEN